MNWLTTLKVDPRWLIAVRLLVALLLGAAVSTLTAGRLSDACRAELQEAVSKLSGL